MKRPAVYILASKKNGTVYVGVTTNIIQRLAAHQKGSHSCFSRTYNCQTLVYIEYFDTIVAAIEREKQLKAGSRKKKLALIEKQNPMWLDLSHQVSDL